MTREAYHTIGKTVGALAKRAEEIYLSLNEIGQEAVHQLFLRLVTPGEGTSDTRRRVTRSELLAIANDMDLMDEVLDTYTEYRLLSVDTDPGTRNPTVEVAHEALLREWERLRAWLHESREDIRQQRIVAQAADAWTANKCDASYLLSGTRLEQSEMWYKATELALTPLERDFIAASITSRAAQHKAEAERQAREIRLEQRSRNFLRALVGVFASAALVAVILFLIALNQGKIAQANAAEARHLALVNGARAALGNDNLDLALELAVAANEQEHPSALAQLTLAESAYSPGTFRRFQGHTTSVISAAFSPDGRTVVSAGCYCAGDVSGGELLLWDVVSGHIIHNFSGYRANFSEVTFSPNGRTVLTGLGSYDYVDDFHDTKEVLLFDVETGQLIRQFVGHQDEVLGVNFSPDGRYFLSASKDQTVILWDVATGEPIHVLRGHTDVVRDAAFSPDGSKALSASFDGTIILWDLETGEIIHRFGVEGEGHHGQVVSVAFSPDGKTALSGSTSDYMMILWDLETYEVIRRFEDGYPVVRVLFSPDGKQVISGNFDAPALWDVQTGKLILRLQGHNREVQDTAFSPDGRYVLTASIDHDVRIWDLHSGSEITQIPLVPRTFGRAAALSPDGRTLLVGTGGLSILPEQVGQVLLYDVATGQQIRSFDEQVSGSNDDIQAVVFSPDGQIAVSGRDGGSTTTWDVASGQALWHIEGQSSAEPWFTNSVAISPDGRNLLVSSVRNQSVTLYNLLTGEVLFQLKPDTGPTGVAFSPDGRLAAFGDIHGRITLWDFASGDILRVLGADGQGHAASVSRIDFDTTGTMLLSGSEDTTIILWAVSTGQLLRRFVGHAGLVSDVQFSPDGKTIFSSSMDFTLIQWDIATGEILRRFTGHVEPVGAMALSADGKTLYSVGFDSVIYAWRVDTESELLRWTQANRYVPELTCDQRELYRLEPLCEKELH